MRKASSPIRKLPAGKRTVSTLYSPALIPISQFRQTFSAADISELVRSTRLSRVANLPECSSFAQNPHMASVKRFASHLNGLDTAYRLNMKQYETAPDGKGVKAHFMKMRKHADALFNLLTAIGHLDNIDALARPSPFVETMLLSVGVGIEAVRDAPGTIRTLSVGCEQIAKRGGSFRALTGETIPSHDLIAQLADLYERVTGTKAAIVSNSETSTGPFARFAYWICKRVGAPCSPKQIRRGIELHRSRMPKSV